jgi:hypothetical protein
VCGTVSIYSEHIGRRCARRRGIVRCHGRFKAVTAREDWLACAACATTGEHGGEPCAHCAGDGWLYFTQPAARGAASPPRPGSRST